MTPSGGRIEALIRQVQSRFLETPELTLTPSEAQECFGVDEIACDAVMSALVDARVLAKTRDGDFVRFFARLVVLAERAGARLRTQAPQRRERQARPVAVHSAGA